MNQLFEIGNKYAAKSDWRDFALTKICLFSLGIIAACNHNGLVDNATMVLAVLGISVPNFVAAALLQYYIGLKLGWLPIGFWKSWSCSVLPSVALCFSPLAKPFQSC